MKVTNSAIDIYLELNDIENISVRVACRFDLAHLLLTSLFQDFLKIIKCGL